jgi:single-stranded DNA-specific DHH superfamily exonuclease
MDMKDVIDFLNRIRKKDEIVIIYNNDADGICSCALLDKFFLRKIGKKSFSISQPMPMDKNLIQRIQTTLPTKLIFLDLAVDQQQSILKKLGSVCDILIIDHHQYIRNLSKNNIVHYNPRFDKSSIYQSTSYLVYKICSRIMNISDMLWIAAVGMIADYNLKDSMDLVKEIEENYKTKIHESLFARIADMISATRATRAMTCEEILEVIEKIEDPKDFEKTEGTEKLVESYQQMENEIIALLSDAEAVSEKTGNLILYEMKSKYNLRADLSRKLSEKHPNKLVIVYETGGNNVKLRARNQDVIDVGKVLQKAAEGMKASAGGHENAAGATLQADDWEEFKQRLLELIG